LNVISVTIHSDSISGCLQPGLIGNLWFSDVISVTSISSRPDGQLFGESDC
jgi:hypothetical protein